MTHDGRQERTLGGGASHDEDAAVTRAPQGADQSSALFGYRDDAAVVQRSSCCRASRTGQRRTSRAPASAYSART